MISQTMKCQPYTRFLILVAYLRVVFVLQLYLAVYDIMYLLGLRFANFTFQIIPVSSFFFAHAFIFSGNLRKF